MNRKENERGAAPETVSQVQAENQNEADVSSQGRRGLQKKKKKQRY